MLQGKIVVLDRGGEILDRIRLSSTHSACAQATTGACPSGSKNTPDATITTTPRQPRAYGRLCLTPEERLGILHNLLIAWSSRFGLIPQLLNLGLAATAYLFLPHLVGREALAQPEPTAAEAFPFTLFGSATKAAILRGLNGLAPSLQLHQQARILKTPVVGSDLPTGYSSAIVGVFADMRLARPHALAAADRGIGRLV